MEDVTITEGLVQACVADADTARSYRASIGVNRFDATFTGFCRAKNLLPPPETGKEGGTCCG